MCTETPRTETLITSASTAAANARQFLRDSGCSAHKGWLIDDAMLLVTELVTNAVLHGEPPLTVAVECRELALEIRVRDSGADLPLIRTTSVEDESGRGMLLLSSVAADWGVERMPAGGKEVWFQLGVG